METSLQPECSSTSNVLQRIADFQLMRQQTKTRDELSEIKTRIQNALEDYDDSRILSADPARVEFLDDMKQFEAIIKDNFLKNEYQQKLSIFIVGYKNLCTQRLDILSQLSEFFSIYNYEDDTDEAISDSQVEDLNETMQATLDTMENALAHLDDVGRGMLGYMGHLHSVTSSKTTKSRKKLEKSLQNAKDEILKLTEKIRLFQQDLGSRDTKIEKINMHLDAKKMEIANLKNQLEILKRTHATMEEKLRQEKNVLEGTLEQLREEVEVAQSTTHQSATNVTQNESKYPVRNVESKLQEIRDTALDELARLKLKIEAEAMDVPHIKRELAEHFQVQLEQMRIVHTEELDDWRKECCSHILKNLEIEVGDEESQKWMQQGSQSGSGQTKEKQSSPYQTSSVYSDPKPPTTGDPNGANQQQNDDNTTNGDRLANLSVEEIAKQFNDYRQTTMEEIALLKEKLQPMDGMQETMRTEALKWQEEKSRLLSHIEELKLLQEAAEADAEEAMKNLEEFAAEQEQLASVNQESTHFEEDASHPLTEDNVQQLDDSIPPRAASPSTFSKPASPMTSRSLVSAYRQKIAERRDAINRRRAEAVVSRSGQDTPQHKGMFDGGLLEEFLRSYRAVVQFKDKITEEMSHYPTHQIKAHSINSVKTDNYDTSDDQVQVFVSRMSSSVEQVLSCISENVNSLLADTTSEGNDKLRLQIGRLQEELSNLRAEYEKRSQHDAAMIMHMQNTLSETQRGNTTAAGTSGSGFPSSPAVVPMFGKTPSTSHRPPTNESDVTIIFTRQDTDHNAVELKKSATAGKITQGTLESVVTTMEAYNDIPTRRIQHLANKLLHHRNMKVIETNVRNSNLVTSEVFTILEKMETLQQRRAQAWARQMDEMTSERRRLAILLCDALPRLENITGAFLIKPVVSFKGRSQFRKYSGKISTKFNKHQVEAMLQKMLIKKSQMGRSITAHDVGKHGSLPPTSGNRVYTTAMKPNVRSSQPLTVAGRTSTTWVNTLSSCGGLRATRNLSCNKNVKDCLKSEEAAVNMWNVNASLSHSLPESRTRRGEKAPSVPLQIHPSTVPKLLELDIGRYQVDQANVHSLISPKANIGNDRIRNMEILRLRSQTNVRRDGTDMRSNTNMEPSPKPQESPSLLSSPDYKSSAPPTTPASLSQVIGRSDSSAMRFLSADDVTGGYTPTSPKPLPPIRMTSIRSNATSGGSSKRITPLSPSRSMPDMTEVENVTSPIVSARKNMATSPEVS